MEQESATKCFSLWQGLQPDVTKQATDLVKGALLTRVPETKNFTAVETKGGATVILALTESAVYTVTVHGSSPGILAVTCLPLRPGGVSLYETYEREGATTVIVRTWSFGSLSLEFITRAPIDDHGLNQHGASAQRDLFAAKLARALGSELYPSGA